MSKIEIPTIDLSGEVLGLGRESEEWKDVAKKVRDACENYGIFIVEKYEKIPIGNIEELLSITKELFDLPQEKKQKYVKPSVLDGGFLPSNPATPLYEALGIYGDDEVQAFEQLMWPLGKPGFREFQNSINAKLMELGRLLLRMIFESYGLGEYYESKDVDKCFVGELRFNKYRIPKQNDDKSIGLVPHVDKSLLTILCQNSVQGLEALSKDGNNWIQINIPKGALAVNVGDALQAWSNGRLHSVRHRVVTMSNTERYSCGFFTRPKDGMTIEVPGELVDEEHPLCFRPFIYSEYFANSVYKSSLDSIQIHAGI